jgi:hypothetical protein
MKSRTLSLASIRIPLLVALLMTVAFVSTRSRDPNELWESAGGIDEQVLIRSGIWLVLGCLAIWCVARARADLRLLRTGPLFWYGLWVIMALVTASYVVAPLLVIYYSLQLGVALVLVISLRHNLDKLPYFASVYVAVFWLLLFAEYLPGGMPGWMQTAKDEYAALAGGDEVWRFGDVFGHPSQLSIVSAVAAIQLAARMNRGNLRTHGPLVAWMVLSTMMAISRTAIAGLVAGMIIVAMAHKSLFRVVLIAGTLLSLAVMFTDLPSMATDYFMRGQTEDEFSSLTGRDVIYNAALRRATESLPFGFGFRSGRKDLLIHDEKAPKIGHSHNLFLEAATGMGIPGLVLAVMIVLTTVRQSVRVLRRPPAIVSSGFQRGELVGMLMPLAAFCIMDLGFASEVTPVLMMYLLVFARIQAEVLGAPIVGHPQRLLSSPAFFIHRSMPIVVPAEQATGRP